MTRWFGFVLVCAVVAAEGSAAWEQHFSAGEAFSRSGDYVRALREFESALREAENLGPRDPVLAVTLTNVGVIYKRLGRYTEAERSYNRAISIFEQYHPNLRTGLATTLHDFGSLSVAQRRWSKADELYRRAYDIRVMALGPDHESVGISLMAMGELAEELKDYDKAENQYLQAWAIFRKIAPPGSLDRADLEHNLAVLYHQMGHAERSVTLFTDAAAAYQRIAPRHPNLAIILRNYAELQADLQDLTAAAESFRTAVAICDVSLPPDSPTTGIILQAYSRFLAKTKRRTEAKALAERARKILGPSFREDRAQRTVDWHDLRTNRLP
jgi:tetratricopeptide (TPR) repeat protein